MTIVSPAVCSGPVSRILEIDRAHPVFFDHATDHVPGMLMIVGMLDTIREAGPYEAAGARPGSRIRAAFAFDRFAEFDAELSIGATCPGAARPAQSWTAQSWTAQAWQREAIVASAEVEYRAQPPDTADHAPAGPVVPAPAHSVAPGLVHQSQAENVLVGLPVWTSTAVRMALLEPPPGHYFAGRAECARGIEEIIEGGRQAAVLLWQLEYDRRTGVQLLLDGVELDLPLDLPRGEPAELRWRRTGRRGSAAAFSFAVWLPRRSARPAGTVTIRSRAVSERAFRRLRSAMV
jgi:hypothetical protein